MTTTPQHNPTTPWWRVGLVWLVVGGPATVVVASLATAVVAFRGADEVVSVPAAQAADDAERPAVQARNLGATAQTSKR